jgi:probable HAF family extracellular repeat protein
VDGAGGQPIGPNAAVTISSVAAGAHQVQLFELAAHCTLEGPNPRGVTVPSGGVAEITFSVACEAPTYQVTELDFFPSKINDVGHIAGIRGTFQEEQHLIIWKDGAATDLGVLDYNSYVTGFNVHDVIVGWSQTRTEQFRGWMWDGTMHDLGPDFIPQGIDDEGRMMGHTPRGGEFRSGATSVPVGCSLGGLNNRGQITGTYEFDTPEGGIRSNICLWDNGVFRDLGISAGEGGPTDINNLGVIVAVHDNGFVYRSFIVRDGVMTELPNLGGTNAAEAINDAGIAVGWSDEVFNSDLYVAHPVIWENGVISRLPGEFGDAADINNSGQIVGSIAPTNDGPYRGVLWTPSVGSRSSGSVP